MVNFGRNLSFRPRAVHTPRSAEEVLEILGRRSVRRIRAVGSLHSWSEVARCEDTVLDLRELDEVRVEAEAETGPRTAWVGAGCPLSRLVEELRGQGGLTLPSLGVITRQTISGAVSTGTHGSGAPSLSHHVRGVRIAAYDPRSGAPRVYEWEGGVELRAARCALGCAGILLAVRVECVPDYHVEERLERVRTLDEVLEGEGDHPLQQFALVPFDWSFLVFRRRRVAEPSSPVRAAARRAVSFLGTDVGFHLLLLGILAVGGDGSVRAFYRHVAPHLAAAAVRAADRADRVLTMRHDLFPHMEMEVFVPARRLGPALDLVRAVIDHVAGPKDGLSELHTEGLARAGLLEPIRAAAGTYAHHYPILVRRVLPDDTLISMTAGAEEPWYSLSFFTYRPPSSRDAFGELARLLAGALAALHGARLHWGKHFPLGASQVARAYPDLPAFREHCERVDPRGLFRNRWTHRVLGFGREGA